MMKLWDEKGELVFSPCSLTRVIWWETMNFGARQAFVQNKSLPLNITHPWASYLDLLSLSFLICLVEVHSFGLSSLDLFHFPTEDWPSSTLAIPLIAEWILSSLLVRCHLSPGIRASIVMRKSWISILSINTLLLPCVWYPSPAS